MQAWIVSRLFLKAEFSQGILFCILPADQVIDTNEFDVIWVLQKRLGTILDVDSPKRNNFELDKSDPKKSKLKLRELLKKFNPTWPLAFKRLGG